MLKSNQLLPVARDALVAGGWTEDRRAPRNEALALYVQREICIPDGLVEVVTNLFRIRASAAGRWIDFSPEPSLSCVGQSDLELLGRLTGTQQYPVGSASSAYLFLDSEGKPIFLDADWLFYFSFCDLAGLCNCVLAGDNAAIANSRNLEVHERPGDLR